MPEGVSTSDVSVTSGADGGDVLTLASAVSGLTITASGSKSTTIAGSSIADSTITATPAVGQTAVVSVETSKFVGSDIVNTGAGAISVDVTAGKVKGSSITSGASADSVSFSAKAKLKNVTLELGKGSDTVTFGKKTKIKKGVEIELAGKKNSVIIETNKGVGKLTVSGISSKDKFTVGGEDFTAQEAKNGDAGFQVD